MSVKKTALLSAFDKSGLAHFAIDLTNLGWDLLGSAGTVKHLAERGIIARDVAEIVGPPILGHRVVTLSREIHAGLLAKDTQEDRAELERIGVPFINLVYVNMYPLEEEIAKPEATLESVIEKTDIGGPTMLRSAVKGRRIALSHANEFKMVTEFLSGRSEHSEDRIINVLASMAEVRVGKYCVTSAQYYSKLLVGMK